ncbi:hypothetical protein [Streptomyces sp. NPDC046197]|uniref:hypothetical protein n=1 Tax=Streptomyces sp. NPDC046197 TaxID=3154337 RepID=UPI0033EB5B07
MSLVAVPGAILGCSVPLIRGAMRRMSDSLPARIEQYYATVPLLFADVEEFGPLRLFVRKEPGTPYPEGRRGGKAPWDARLRRVSRDSRSSKADDSRHRPY